MWLRLHDHREHGYREFASCSDSGQFEQIQRFYGGSDARLSRVALTTKPRVARWWQQAESVSEGWRCLRQRVPRYRRLAGTARARTFDQASDHEVMDFMRALVRQWASPSATIERVQRPVSGVWEDSSAEVSRSAHFIGPAWVGAGRRVEAGETVVGPAILWDAPDARPNVGQVNWQQLEPTQGLSEQTPRARLSSPQKLGKRAFDLVVAALALMVAVPFFPLVMLAIWLEDGKPFFFAHQREGRNGVPFRCFKFRSMRHDAEQIKQQLIDQNQVDGPQFYMENDPRLTRVGEFIRRYHIDELPQLYNVLKGEMSIVGPRPSPYEENQYSPPWREARLSVNPGMTGLWQVKRTRQTGHDFQEWIKYDLEYVENASFSLDLWIIWRTVVLMVSRKC
jgi:lipopolysaccharide/colanic/teichoic acid biosynthesis glycosyltransferase